MAEGSYEIEPSANIRTMAHAIREIYVALRNEGFSDQQALMLLGQMFAANAQSKKDEEEDK